MNQNGDVGEFDRSDKVEKLICSDFGCWREEVIRRNFNPQVAESILKTPLCSELPADRFV